MKKFLLKIAILAAYIAIVQVVLPIYVDPFNVFHYRHIRSTPVEPNKNYIKMKYIIENPKKFSGFIFGSSRVGQINPEKIPGGKIYNMTYSMGVPSEHLANLRTMLANNAHPSIVYIGVDDFSIYEVSENHIMQPLRCPYEYLASNPEHFYSLYMNPQDTLNTLWIMLTNPAHSVKDIDTFYNKGWNGAYGRKTKIPLAEIKYTKYTRSYGDEESDRKMMKRTLNDMREIMSLCNMNGIKTVIFTNPLYYEFYMKAMDRNYADFLEGLAEITDFYNFSSLNSITLDRNNYIDVSHYMSEIGDIMINVMCNGKSYPELQRQGFGVKVTRENVKEFVSMLRSQAENFRTE